ncbi:MAG: aminopeptidase, partial [Luteimonas sp.]|nr:aminopeptidase [Luteimonas sp.]
MRYPLILLCAGTTLLAACGREPAAPAAQPAATPAAEHAFRGEIDADDFRALVTTLASDEYEGRAPGSAGEDKTVGYIKAQYERIGLKPGGENDSYFQTVPMVETTADESTVLKLDSAGGVRELKFGRDFVLGTRTGKPEVGAKDSALVFVGYGVNAPEQGWNDYAGLDVKGKTVVILVNDPGFHAKDESLFDGNRM